MFKKTFYLVGFLLGTLLRQWRIAIAILLFLIVIAQMLTVAQMGELRCSGLDYIILGDFNNACKIHRAWRSN